LSALAVELAPGLRLANPVIAAAGSVGGGADFERLLSPDRLGAVVVGPIGRRRAAADGRGLVETPAGLLWSGASRRAGIEATLRVDLPRWRRWGVPTIANLAGADPAELVEIAEALAGATGLAALELDTGELDERDGRAFDQTPARAAALTLAVREAVELPLIVKLWQGSGDLRATAEAVRAAGADVLSLVNAPAGIVIDTRSRRPLLGGAGRLCGPATRPMAVRMVYELAGALPGVPLIAAGGVTCADDALQFIMAGARAVQVGTATLVDPTATVDIIEELETLVGRDGMSEIEGLIGAAL
jgi:dihydroorotate dehydrogenase (NAD+) catalytic subunit